MMRYFSLILVFMFCYLPIGVSAQASPLPNFVILFADDLGYGDLGCYGHPTIRTPSLDRMAAEGMRFTQFYSAACVCTPSRAALLTGRLPIRSGMCHDQYRVLGARSLGGLPAGEITIAEALKTKGYATTCIGKWHLGHKPQYLPMQQGFDSYFGLPYSNDMGVVPLMRGQEIIEKPVDQSTLTKRYTDHALRFIEQNKDRPFFLYLPYTFPHTPLFASKRFKGTSPRGLYGDVVEELDFSVGQILDKLRKLKLADNTLVIFTSDNGPWLLRGLHGGSAGLLRDGKGCTWEGGMREPAVAWWPGKVKAGVVSDAFSSTLDVLPTILKLADIEVPEDRVIDGVDLSPVLLGTGSSPREIFFYYRGTRLMAVRKGPWKAHFYTQPAFREPSRQITVHWPPLLFNLDQDPSEQHDQAKKHAGVIADIMSEIERHRAGLQPAKSQLAEHAPRK